MAEAAVVNNIVVNGATRIEDETVRDYLTIRPGRTFSAIDIDESLTTLYATGLFADVSIEQQGNTLVVNVQENPVINRISFEGNSRLNDQALQSVVRSSERSMLTRARVQSDAQNLLEAYRRSGRFRASVEPKISSVRITVWIWCLRSKKGIRPALPYFLHREPSLFRRISARSDPDP